MKHPAYRLLSRLSTAANGCWEWQGGQNDGGYGVMRYLGARNVRIHRLMWELRHGSIPSGLLVCHHCDNRICGNPDHLFLGTIIDNMLDRDRKGRVAHGDNHYKRRQMRRQND